MQLLYFQLVDTKELQKQTLLTVFATSFLGSLKGSRRSLLSYRIGCGSWFTNKSHLDNRCIGGLLLLYVRNVAAKLRCIEHTGQQTFVAFRSYAMKSFQFHYFSRDLIIRDFRNNFVALYFLYKLRKLPTYSACLLFVPKRFGQFRTKNGNQVQ